MKNETKYELNEESGKYDVFYRGFDYMTLKTTNGWKNIRTVDTEDDAKKVCADCLAFED